MEEDPVFKSSKRNRLYKRKFDWDEARRRHAAGESMRSIAESLGVNKSAVQRVVRLTKDATRPAEADDAGRVVAPYKCPRCGGPKSYSAALCDACWRSGWYGKGLEEEWDLFEPTTLADVWPPPNYLSYTPKHGGRYCICTTWGFAEHATRNIITGTLALVDTLAGTVVEETPSITLAEVPRIRSALVQRCKAMNARDVADRDGAAA